MKCIIIDDEPIARKGMKRLVDAHPDLELEASLGSAESAETWLAEHRTDLVFLDIEMPGMNGIDFARSLPDSCMVIFTTAYSEYAVESYEVEAIDYLVKPIDTTRFDKAVARALAYRRIADSARYSTEEDMEFIIVKSDRKYMRVKVADILYVEGLKDYVIIHMPDRRVVTRMTVKAIEEMLPRRIFIRIGKSYIVNRDKVDSFDSKDVAIGNAELAIGSAYRDSVLDFLMSGV